MSGVELWDGFQTRKVTIISQCISPSSACRCASWNLIRNWVLVYSLVTPLMDTEIEARHQSSYTNCDLTLPGHMDTFVIVPDQPWQSSQGISNLLHFSLNVSSWWDRSGYLSVDLCSSQEKIQFLITWAGSQPAIKPVLRPHMGIIHQDRPDLHHFSSLSLWAPECCQTLLVWRNIGKIIQTKNRWREQGKSAVMFSSCTWTFSTCFCSSVREIFLSFNLAVNLNQKINIVTSQTACTH